MVDEHSAHDPLADLSPVSDTAEVQSVLATVRDVHVAPELRRYAVELVSATRRMPEVRLGASPRATLHLVRAARAQAALSGREFVVPDDMHVVAGPVLAHRLVLTPESITARRTAPTCPSLLGRLPVPHGPARARPVADPHHHVPAG